MYPCFYYYIIPSSVFNLLCLAQPSLLKVLGHALKTCIVEILTDQLFLQRSEGSVGNFIFLFKKALLLTLDAN